jgi:hypothetical protein
LSLPFIRATKTQHETGEKEMKAKELEEIVRLHSYDESAARQLLGNKRLVCTLARALAKAQDVDDALDYLMQRVRGGWQLAGALRVLASYVGGRSGNDKSLHSNILRQVRRCCLDYAATQLLFGDQALAVLAQALDLVEVASGVGSYRMLTCCARAGKGLLEKQLGGETRALALEVLRKFYRYA